MSIDGIPDDEVEKIKKRLLDQISAMSASEKQIVFQSEQSLALYIGETFRALAGLVGYVIAVPIAFVARITKELYTGVTEGAVSGWKTGWRTGWRTGWGADSINKKPYNYQCHHCNYLNSYVIDFSKKGQTITCKNCNQGLFTIG